MGETDKSKAVAEICGLLFAGKIDAAREIAQLKLPFEPIPKRVKRTREKSEAGPSPDIVAARRVTNEKKLKVWQRDGFRCRYTGRRLVFPQTLELLSLVLPNELPYDNPPHGKHSRTHIIMWELWPAVDHQVALCKHEITALANSIHNLVTASTLVNSEKWAYDLDYLGWKVLPAEPMPDWDGLAGWYVQYLNQDNSWFSHATSGRRLQRWYKQLTKIDPT